MQNPSKQRNKKDRNEKKKSSIVNIVYPSIHQNESCLKERVHQTPKRGNQKKILSHAQIKGLKQFLQSILIKPYTPKSSMNEMKQQFFMDITKGSL